MTREAKKPKKDPPERQEKYLQTEENWAPSITLPGKKGKFVRARFSQLLDGATWRVSIWGGDDLGMEHDSPIRSYALKLYMTLPNPVTFEQLERAGFVRA